MCSRCQLGHCWGGPWISAHPLGWRVLAPLFPLRGAPRGGPLCLPKVAQAPKADGTCLFSPPGRDPSVSQAWAFSPGGPAASPGARRRTWASPADPTPALGKVVQLSMRTTAASTDAEEQSMCPSRLSPPCHPGPAPAGATPEVPVSLQTSASQRQHRH